MHIYNNIIDANINLQIENLTAYNKAETNSYILSVRNIGAQLQSIL